MSERGKQGVGGMARDGSKYSGKAALQNLSSDIYEPLTATFVVAGA